jgi:hypothetical protein
MTGIKPMYAPVARKVEAFPVLEASGLGSRVFRI